MVILGGKVFILDSVLHVDREKKRKHKCDVLNELSIAKEEFKSLTKERRHNGQCDCMIYCKLYLYFDTLTIYSSLSY